MTKWRVVIDDTGGPYTGWPSIVDDEKDCCILYTQGFWDHESFRVAGITQRDAVELCHQIVEIHNGNL